MQTAPDGTKMMKNADGSFVKVPAEDGSTTAKNPKTLVQDPNGNYFLTNPDGTKTVV